MYKLDINNFKQSKPTKTLKPVVKKKVVKKKVVKKPKEKHIIEQVDFRKDNGTIFRELRNSRKITRKNIQQSYLEKTYNNNINDKITYTARNNKQKLQGYITFYDKAEFDFSNNPIEENNTLYLELVVAKKLKSNKGLGTKLINKMYDYGKMNGYKKIEAETNDVSVGFYEKLGWNVKKETQQNGINNYIMSYDFE